MMTIYGGHEVTVGCWVVAGVGEDRDAGQVLDASSESITIGWDSGVKTTIDLLSHVVDDDTIEVHATRASARTSTAR